MKLTIYQTDDDANVIGKTLTDDYEIDIFLAASTDIVNPIIPLEAIDGVDYGDYNYAYIDELERYYFIDEVESINARICSLSMTCDVIETYKAEILASNARYMRSMKNGDYIQFSLPATAYGEVDNYESTKELTGDVSMILSTIGAK